MSEQKNKLLEVKDLKVSFFTPAGEVKAVGGISYDLDYGEVMGVVGESGSGKSQEAYSIMGLLQSPGKVIGGSITFEGKDVLSFSKEEMTAFRGNKVAMIFQNPMTWKRCPFFFQGRDDCVPRKQSSYDFPESHDLEKMSFLFPRKR